MLMKRIALNRCDVMTIFTEKSSKFPTEISCEKNTKQEFTARADQTHSTKEGVSALTKPFKSKNYKSSSSRGTVTSGTWLQ